MPRTWPDVRALVVRSRGRDAPTRAGKRRCRTIVGGVGLGLGLAAALVLAGAVHVRVTGPDHPTARATPSPELDPLTATQPELADALLAVPDLPEGYRPAASPRAAVTAVAGRTERCEALLDRPWEVTGADIRERAVAEYAGHGEALLRQALALLDPGGAERAVGELRRASRSCPEFGARLEDGTAVRVRLEEMPIGRIGDEAYAVRLTARPAAARDETGTRHGYLAVGRIGPVLSVLRQLGPEQASHPAPDPAQVTATLLQSLLRAACKEGPLLIASCIGRAPS